MTLFQSLSLVNIIALLTGMVLMVQVLMKYEIPRSWHWFYFLFFVSTFLFFWSQCYTMTTPVGKTLIKLAVSFYAVMVFVFCKAVKSVSMVKENFYKSNDMEEQSIQAEQPATVTGTVSFGLAQIKNPTPVWVNWCFRIVLYAASLTTFIVTTAKGIPDSVAIHIASYCSLATMIAHGLSKMVGIDISKDAEDAKSAFNQNK